jgi:HD-GYP domain-containing protein (c-di-GMP phosphodiesterase class II)
VTLEPTVADQEQMAATRRRVRAKMSRRTAVVEAMMMAGLAGASAAVWWVAPPHGLSVSGAAWSVAVLVLASRVRFETPFGFTVPSQLAFVPLVFAVPAALVVPAVVVGLCLARLPELATGAIRLATVLRTPANGWFAVGPALVFALAGVAPRHAAAGLLVAALAAQFAADFVSSAIRFRAGRGVPVRTQLADSWVYVVDAALSGVALAVADEVGRTPAAVLAVVPLLGLLAMFARERTGRMDSLLELNEAYRGAARLLGDMITADDEYTGKHSRGVVGLTAAVGERLGLDPARRRNLEFGALLHDVGKIVVPKAIINKPGKLTPAEWEVVKTHTIEGQRMLLRLGGFMREVAATVRAHHERWDGNGYPDGLAGTDIPLEARIITACDSWSAMRTDRPYRQALSHEAAVAEIVTGTGGQFDPAVAAALLAVVRTGSGAGLEAAAGGPGPQLPVPAAV